MKIYTVKENHIGSEVAEMYWYKQTHTHILLLSYSDMAATLEASRGILQKGWGAFFLFAISLGRLEVPNKNIQRKEKNYFGSAAIN